MEILYEGRDIRITRKEYVVSLWDKETTQDRPQYSLDLLSGARKGFRFIPRPWKMKYIPFWLSDGPDDQPCDKYGFLLTKSGKRMTDNQIGWVHRQRTRKGNIKTFGAWVKFYQVVKDLLLPDIVETCEKYGLGIRDYRKLYDIPWLHQLAIQHPVEFSVLVSRFSTRIPDRQDGYNMQEYVGLPTQERYRKLEIHPSWGKLFPRMPALWLHKQQIFTHGILDDPINIDLARRITRATDWKILILLHPDYRSSFLRDIEASRETLRLFRRERGFNNTIVSKTVVRAFNAYLHDYLRGTGWDVGREIRTGFQELYRRAERWHRDEEQRQRERDAERLKSQYETQFPESPLPLEWNHPGTQLVYLSNGQMLYEEGRKQAHCVAGYVYQCSQGRSYIYSIRKDDDSPALATIEVNSEGRVIQFYGPGNKAINSKTPIRREFEKLLRKWDKEKSKASGVPYVIGHDFVDLVL